MTRAGQQDPDLHRHQPRAEDRGRNGSDPKSGECWHCGDKTHTTRDCKSYQEILKANGGKRPAGYKGFAEKKWEKTKQHVKAVTEAPAAVDEGDDSDTESDASGAHAEAERRHVMGFALPWSTPKKTVAAVAPRGRTLTSKTPVNNVYDLLSKSDDEGDDDDESTMVQALQQFAHRVNVSSKKVKTKKPVASKAAAVTPDQVGDLHVKANKIISSLQKENKQIDDAGEVEYALIDSGSGVHCMNKKKHFLHVKAKKSGKALSCATANGSPMLGGGLAKAVEFTTDEGHDCSITFDDLPVSMPIIAVKLLSLKGHRTVFDDEDGGGTITQKSSGQRTQLIERDGVYFLRMSKPRQKEAEGFSRPGRNNSSAYRVSQ